MLGKRAKQQRLLIKFLVLTISAGMMLPAGPAAALQALNDTGPSTITQLQQVVNVVCTGDHGHRASDINHDGTVDVRDFQALVAQSQGHDATKDSSSKTDPAQRAVLVSDTFVRSLSFLPGALILEQTLLSDEGSSIPSPIAYAAFLPPQNDRYLFVLTPHAPPLR